MSEDLPRSIVMVRLGSVEAPYKYVPNCDTCQSPHRAFIEQQAMLGNTYPSIEDEIADYDHEGRDIPSRVSMMKHMQKHVPLHLARRMAIYEARAKERGDNIVDSVNSSLDHVSVAKLILQRGHERMESGDIEPDMKDVLAAANMLAKLESEVGSGGGIDFNIFRTAFQSLMEITEAYLPMNAREPWRNAVKRDPILNQLREQIAAQQAAQQAAILGEVV